MSRSLHLDLKAIRQELQVTQAELARLLAVSIRTVQSCEQGWRKPGSSLEQSALLLLLARRNGKSFGGHRCWSATGCRTELRQECGAYWSRQGHLCWYLTGTLCQGQRHDSWTDKLRFCMGCEFFRELLGGELPVIEADAKA